MSFYRQLGLCSSAVALTWLAGCATPIVPYQAPVGGDTAKLFIKGQLSSAAISRFDTFGHSEQCTEPQSLATATAGKIDATIDVPVNAPFTVRLFQQLPALRCSYIATFDPKKNHKYYLEPFDTQQVCGFAIFDVTSGDRVLDTTTRKRIDLNSRKTFCSAESTRPVAQAVQEANRKPSLRDLKDLLPQETSPKN